MFRSGKVQTLLKKVTQSGISRRSIAATVAVLLLATQLLAAAHVHPGMFIKSVSDSAHEGVAEIGCPVCIFHAHTATNAAVTFVLILPFLAEAFVATAIRSRLLCTPKAQLFGRAPPASV